MSPECAAAGPSAPETEVEEQVAAQPERGGDDDGDAMTPEHALLLAKLTEFDGQDAYSVITTSLGKVHRNFHLAIPENVVIKEVQYKDVGTKEAAELYTYEELACIYVANKGRCSDPTHANAKAFIQMEAIVAGWVRPDFQHQPEVLKVAALNGNECLKVLLNDFENFQKDAATYKTAAYLVPLVAEHVFRTLGHHFLTSDTAVYLTKYRSTFRACLVPEVADCLAPNLLFHEALHWVTPYVARQVLEAQLESPTLPEAIKIRAQAAPAGTTIVTTTAALLDAMAKQKLDEGFAKQGGFDLKQIRDVNTLIREAPTKYHKAYFAYQLNPLTEDEKDALQKALNAAVAFAPVSQAFISVYLSDAALSHAKALAKHAQLNPVLVRRWVRYFKGLRKREVTTIASIFEDVDLVSNKRQAVSTG